MIKRQASAKLDSNQCKFNWMSTYQVSKVSVITIHPETIQQPIALDGHETCQDSLRGQRREESSASPGNADRHQDQNKHTS